MRSSRWSGVVGVGMAMVGFFFFIMTALATEFVEIQRNISGPSGDMHIFQSQLKEILCGETMIQRIWYIKQASIALVLQPYWHRFQPCF